MATYTKNCKYNACAYKEKNCQYVAKKYCITCVVKNGKYANYKELPLKYTINGNFFS